MSVDVQDPPDYYRYDESGRRWPFLLLIFALGFLVVAGLGILWVYTEFIHARAGVEERGQLQVTSILRRIDPLQHLGEGAPAGDAAELVRIQGIEGDVDTLDASGREVVGELRELGAVGGKRQFF